jgi:NADH-quinone oxidoreductase subunit L
MTVPLMILGALAIGAGFLNAEALHGALPLWFERWLGPGIEEGVPHIQIAEAREHLELPLVGVSIVVALGSIFFAWSWYGKGPSPQADRVAKGVPRLYQLVLDKWRIDELYDRTIVRGLQRLGRFGAETFDPGFIDRVMVHGAAGLAKVGGQLLRLVQTGRVQIYAMVMAAGMAGILFKLTIPEADFERQVEGQRVTLEAPKGPGYEYRWSFPDAPRHAWTEWSSDPRIAHDFTTSGGHTVKLEVRSPLGTAASEQVVQVRAPAASGRTPRAQRAQVKGAAR